MFGRNLRFVGDRLLNRNKPKTEDETALAAPEKRRFGLFGKKASRKAAAAKQIPEAPVDEVTPKDAVPEDVEEDEVPDKTEEETVNDEAEPEPETLKEEEAKDAAEEQTDDLDERDAPEQEEQTAEEAATEENAEAVEENTGSTAAVGESEITPEMVEAVKAKALGSKSISTGFLCGCI